MAKSKRNRQKKLPPHLDPEKYIWVKTKEGGYPRKRRGTVKGAELNETLKANTGKTAIVSSYNKRIRDGLAPYTDDIVMGRVGNRMNKLMFAELRNSGTLHPGGLKWLELNEEYPLDELLNGAWSWGVDVRTKSVIFKIPIPKQGAVPKVSKLVDSYVFTVLLAHWDGKKKSGYHVGTSVSQVYKFDKTPGECELRLPIPGGKPHWLLLIRAECYEEGQPGSHPMHKRMRVIAGGIGQPGQAAVKG